MTEKLNDLLPTTPDVQAERLAELKRLFPDLFDGEGQLKLDEVKQLTGDEPQCRERYDFSWYGKRKAKETAYTPTTATLSYDEARSVNPEKANGNLIIEGENLESLKALLSAYRESIKCIYIDPPYNTGKDFVYSDNYTENKRAYWEETGGLEKGVKVDTNPETAGRYHSNWLSMMYSRLILARQLLKDDGVIFVSIDDNEVHNLRRLMDDVFGEENFVVELVWEKKVSPSNDSQFFSNDHEYILVYAKEKNAGVISRLERTAEHNKYYKNPDNDPRGIWNSTAATCNKSHLERPNLYYSITNPNTDVEIYPSKSAVWATSKERMSKLLKDNRIYWGKDGASKSPRIKIFLTEAGKVVPRSVLKYKDVGHTQSATRECKIY
jgi:adenine-specific DNA-methyltransferase